MAVIVRGNNAGGLVHVDHVEAVLEDDTYWSVTTMSSLITVMVGRDMKPFPGAEPGRLRAGAKATIPDSALRPLPGDGLDDDAHDDLELHQPTGTEVLT